MGRPPKHPVETKLKIVLSAISAETSPAEAARRHGVSETSIGRWKDQFPQAGRQGLEHGTHRQAVGSRGADGRRDRRPPRALGEAHVQIRALKRGGPQAMTFR